MSLFKQRCYIISPTKSILRPGFKGPNLDVFTPVDDGVGPVRVEPADGEEGVALGEEVLLVQVGSGELESNLVLETGLLLGVNNLKWRIGSLTAM